MFNVTFIDNDSARRVPLAILADLAVAGANDSDCDSDAVDAVDAFDAASRDADADEHQVMWAAYRALCESRGLCAIGSYEVTWELYCLGALESAVGWFHLGGYFAPFAWPEHGVALMLSTPLSSCEDDSAEVTAETALHEEARDAAFQAEGWTVVRVDPRSRRLDDQLERVAALVAAQKSEPAS